MNSNYFSSIINKILCDIAELKNAILKKLKVLWNGVEIESDTVSINFTGTAVTDIDSVNGNVTITVTDTSGGGSGTQEIPTESRTILICKESLSGNGTEIEQILEYLTFINFVREDEDGDIFIRLESCGYGYGYGSGGLGIGLTLL